MSLKCQTRDPRRKVLSGGLLLRIFTPRPTNEMKLVKKTVGKTNININNLRENILAWVRIRTRVSSSTRWRYNH